MANQTRLLAMTRLRYDSALYGHAMPFGGMVLTIECKICGKYIISGPVFASQGNSAPISRGSPPFYEE